MVWLARGTRITCISAPGCPHGTFSPMVSTASCTRSCYTSTMVTQKLILTLNFRLSFCFKSQNLFIYLFLLMCMYICVWIYVSVCVCVLRIYSYCFLHYTVSFKTSYLSTLFTLFPSPPIFPNSTCVLHKCISNSWYNFKNCWYISSSYSIIFVLLLGTHVPVPASSRD